MLGSLKCDCREQLDARSRRSPSAGSGVLVYLRQEGRGIGLGNKIRAYALQAQGADTVDANVALGFAADLRSYELAADHAARPRRDLGALMTNNPDKIAGLEEAGIQVSDACLTGVARHEHNREYLESKRTRLGHI